MKKTGIGFGIFTLAFSSWVLASKEKIGDRLRNEAFTVAQVASLKSLLPGKTEVQELMKDLTQAGRVDQYYIASMTGDGQIQIVMFLSEKAERDRVDGGLGSVNEIAVISKRAGKLQVARQEDCSARSAQPSIKDLGGDGRFEIVETCFVNSYRNGELTCTACERPKVTHILGMRDGVIAHVENEFRPWLKANVLPLLERELESDKKSGAAKEDLGPKEESLGLLKDFLAAAPSKSLQKGTCPIFESRKSK